MDDSTDSVTPQPVADTSFLDALQSLATTGANAYTTIQGEKFKEAQAAQQVAANQTLLAAQQQQNASAFWNQKWFWPVVGGFVLVLTLGLLRRPR